MMRFITVMYWLGQVFRDYSDIFLQCIFCHHFCCLDLGGFKLNCNLGENLFEDASLAFKGVPGSVAYQYPKLYSFPRYQKTAGVCRPFCG